MATAWILIDEQGDAKFGPRNSAYFGLAAVTTDRPLELTMTCDELRHSLWMDGSLSRGFFHAHEDSWETRRRVLERFPLLPITRTDAVFLTKAQVYPTLRAPELIYRTVLRILLPHVVKTLAAYQHIMTVVASWPLVPGLASLVEETIEEERLDASTRVLELSAQHHAGLQMADYVAWSSHRLRVRREAWVSYTRAAGSGWSDLTVFEP